MSITDISSVSGYNATQYNDLVETAETKGVDKTLVDQALLSALNNSQSFTQAVDTVGDSLPVLAAPAPRVSTDYYGCSSVPSPGAAILAIMVDGTAQERRDNAEMRVAQTEVIVQKMENQADEMRSKAVAQLVMGVVSGVVSIGMGAATMGMTASSLKQSTAEYGKYTEGLTAGKGGTQTQASVVAKGNYDSMMTRQQGVSTALGQVGSGAGSILDGINQFIGTTYDAKLKEMDADLEKQRAFRDSLQSLDEALSQQISKALSTMEAIQSDMNQTRTRIIG